MFGFSPVGHKLQILHWLTIRLFQPFLTCKGTLIRVLFMTAWPLSTNDLHTPIRCMYPFGQKQGFPPLISTSQTVIEVGLLTI